MWHYVEGIHNWDPIWPMHAIRIIPGPSSLWFDAHGTRLPGPLYPGFDTLGTLRHIQRTGHDYTWFVLTQKIIEKEFALSGSEQNPDTTVQEQARRAQGAARQRPAVAGAGVHGPRRGLHRRALRCPQLVRRMNALTGEDLIDHARARGADRRPRPPARQPVRQGRPDHRDPRRARIPRRQGHARGRPAPDPRPEGRAADRRAAVDPHPQVARRSADRPGLARARARPASRSPGLYAAGEVAGFGGGGMHGYRALEGTFLGGCLFSGRIAGRAAAAATA